MKRDEWDVKKTENCRAEAVATAGTRVPKPDWLTVLLAAVVSGVVCYLTR